MPAARRKRRQTKRKTGIDLTKGQINKIIDIILHIHFRGNPSLILLDGLAHAIVEDDLEQSLLKFAKYGVPTLLKETQAQAQMKGSSLSKTAFHMLGCERWKRIR